MKAIEGLTKEQVSSAIEDLQNAMNMFSVALHTSDVDSFATQTIVFRNIIQNLPTDITSEKHIEEVNSIKEKIESFNTDKYSIMYGMSLGVREDVTEFINEMKEELKKM